MRTVVCANLQHAQALALEVQVTPSIEEGAGPVKLGIPVPLGRGKYGFAHRWEQSDVDWLWAYSPEWIEEIRCE